MINSENIFYHELIGLELKVINSSNKSLIGLSGIVIDETKKTLKIETSTKGEKFHIILPDKSKVEIDGKILLNRPEDRIKKRYKKI
jgi:ribonuclease P protein subunit POP4